MPGLYLGGGVRTQAQATYGNASPPTTASQAAFGESVTSASKASALSPNDAGGVAFWIGAAGVAFLAFLYYTLPG